MRRFIFATLLALALTTSAGASTMYVANDGVDGPGCGPKGSPCRSIGQAANFSAAAGDTVVVGPGTYGDLNQDGVLGNTPGEETGAFGCMVVIAQTVTLTSSDGAAATIVDARNVSIGCNVGILADDVRFGRPGRGFTVTNTNSFGIGIELAGTNITVSGNQVVGTGTGSAVGIETSDNTNTALIMGNEVIRWSTGIDARGTGKTLRKNQVSQSNAYGIASAGSADISGNVITNCLFYGIHLPAGTATVSGNAIRGNGTGIFTHTPFTGKIEKNDIFANVGCGLQNGNTGGSIHYTGVTGLDAMNNYWGAATGPGPDPADQAGGACNPNGGSTTVAPFATKPFSVKAPVKF